MGENMGQRKVSFVIRLAEILSRVTTTIFCHKIKLSLDSTKLITESAFALTIPPTHLTLVDEAFSWQVKALK